MRLRSWLTNLCGNLIRPTFQTTPRRRRTPQRSASADVELLEPRQLLSAAPIPLGPTVDVNSGKPGSQDASPSVASNASGDYIVVWSTTLADKTSEIDGQRFGVAGNAEGTNFTISKSTSTTVELIDPHVAIDNKGEFVVTWPSTNLNSNNEITGISIRAQRYNQFGKAQGAELTIGSGKAPVLFANANSVGMDSMGEFVVVWDSNNASIPGVAEFIYAQVYNWSGTVKGSRITVATGDGSTTFAELSTAAMDSKGDFVVA